MSKSLTVFLESYPRDTMLFEHYLILHRNKQASMPALYQSQVRSRLGSTEQGASSPLCNTPANQIGLLRSVHAIAGANPSDQCKANQARHGG